MQIESVAFEKEPFVLEIDIAKMELGDIFNFLKKNKNISKIVLKDTIEALLKVSLVKAKIKLRERELALFNKSLVLAELNTRPQTILSTLLLMLYHARGRKLS